MLCGGGGGGVLRNASSRFGVTRSATNSTMNGMLMGRPPSQLMSPTYLVDSAAAMPMSSPPRYVSGRLEKYPTAAAPNACTTSRIRRNALTPMVGPSSNPDIAAKHVPITHAQRRTRVGLVPAMFARSGSSTTARMDTPRRDQRKNRYSPMADTSAITMVISWLYPTLTSKTVNVSVGRKSGNRTYCPGSLHELPQRRSSASMPSVSPIMPAIWYCTPTRESIRVSSSSTRPMAGPSTNRHSNAAGGQAMPCWTCSQ